MCDNIAFHFESMYVGMSRVRSGEDLRMCHLRPEDIDNLLCLKPAPELSLWMDNYDDHGRWKIGGLADEEDKRRRRAFDALRAIKDITSSYKSKGGIDVTGLINIAEDQCIASFLNHNEV